MKLYRLVSWILASLLLFSCANTSEPPPGEPQPAQRAPTPSPGTRETSQRAAGTSQRAAENYVIPDAPPRPANSRGRVLFLGDSFSVGAFGRTFDQALRNAGFEVYTSVAGGGSPYYWLSAYPPVSIDITYWERTPSSQRRLRSISAVPKLETLMAKWQPDIVVVQTGTNLYASLRSSRRSKEANVREVESLVSKMGRAISAGGARCFWITPPSASTNTYPQELQDEMLAITRRAVSPYGRIFDSYAVTERPTGSDGIHLGPSKARAWAQRAASDFIATH